MKTLLRIVAEIEMIFVLGPLHLGVLALFNYLTASLLSLRMLRHGYYRALFTLK